MNGRTISKQRLRQLSEEGFEQAADDVQVLPSLWRQCSMFLQQYYKDNTANVTKPF